MIIFWWLVGFWLMVMILGVFKMLRRVGEVLDKLVLIISGVVMMVYRFRWVCVLVRCWLLKLLLLIFSMFGLF